MIGIDPDLARFAVLIDGVDLPTMEVGSVATSAHGEPRATLDMDLVIGALPEDAQRLAAAFPASRYDVRPVEVIGRELGRARGTFNIIDGETSLKVDVYPLGADALNRAGMADRRCIAVPGAGDIFLALPTTVIGGKLRYYAMSRQDKHLRDIRGMLMFSAPQIDLDVFARLAAQLDLTAVWQDCRDRAGEE